MSAAPWTALVMRVPATAEELLVGALAWCLQGERRIDARPGDDVELWLYLHSPDDETAAVAQARALLEQTGLDPAACRLRVEVVEDGRWVERYQASLEPFNLGSGYRVYPAGRVVEAGTEGEPARRPLILIPGRAFGTGEHPTTRLCTAALEHRVEVDSRWVDLGCGTAILSIVARGCGAREVLAIDDDPEAVDVAREVLETNRASGTDGIEVRRGTATAATAGMWDGVVVNISALFLVEYAATIARLVRPGGLVLASGFIERDLAQVRGALEAEGLGCVDTAVEAPWALAVFRCDR